MTETVLKMRFEHYYEIPPQFKDDVRYSKTLVEYFVETLTKKGDVVFDPFAGFGTTMYVASKMERKGLGTEITREKVEFMQTKMEDHMIIEGDITQIDIQDLPLIDLIMTSPPYMDRDSNFNPFTDYRDQGNYQQYLNQIKHIFSRIKPRLKSGAHIVIEVSNLKSDGKVTTLAWDIGKQISDVFDFLGEIIIHWETENLYTDEGAYGYGYDHSYCLMFRNE
ncbi:MAG: hypothetical protein INQ03_18880 [Candidatus Heimdallarchaeota archaeon]|nr:hypothetical protein [Candidatus Heimdallarchaeota archaeon]